MTESLKPPRRHSIRLPGHDYAQPGLYFVTICVQGRRCLLGDIVGSELRINAAGRSVTSWWKKLPDRYPYVALDEFVLMPNHLHGILHITEVGAVAGRPHGAAPTLGSMIAWFKSMTTNAHIHGVRSDGWAPFVSRLWQRNYYEHIIRGERDLDAVREYIFNNPAKWAADRENSAAISTPNAVAAWQV
jgi:REP element-mobilizing transposase RayT